MSYLTYSCIKAFFLTHKKILRDIRLKIAFSFKSVFKLSGVYVWQTRIFEDEEETENFKISCRNYRKLAWTTGLNLQDDLTDRPIVKVSPKTRRISGRDASYIVNSAQETIERIRLENALRVNLGAKDIITTGGYASQHARDMRILLGSSCLVFNHPGYLKSAENIIKSLHETNYTSGIDAIQHVEERRLLRMLICGNSQRKPSFCHQSQKSDSSNLIPQRGPTTRNHSTPTSRGSSLTEMPSLRNAGSKSILDAYNDAAGFLNSHFNSLDNRKTINAGTVPLNTPQVKTTEE